MNCCSLPSPSYDQFVQTKFPTRNCICITLFLIFAELQFQINLFQTQTQTQRERMGLEIVEPNRCIRGCCTSKSIPLHLPPSSYTLLSPIARGNFLLLENLCNSFSSSRIWLFREMVIIGAESVVYEATLFGKKVAVKKPILSTSDDIDKFHKELQLLWYLSLCEFMYLHMFMFLNMFLCMTWGSHCRICTIPYKD